jgi:hypothetical protein
MRLCSERVQPRARTPVQTRTLSARARARGLDRRMSQESGQKQHAHRSAKPIPSGSLNRGVTEEEVLQGLLYARRVLSRPECGLLKNRPNWGELPDATFTRKEALAAGYKPCQRCEP